MLGNQKVNIWFAPSAPAVGGQRRAGDECFGAGGVGEVGAVQS